MSKQIHLRLSKELYNSIEKEKYNRDYEDSQDLIREILENYFKKPESFFSKLKRVFR